MGIVPFVLVSHSSLTSRTRAQGQAGWQEKTGTMTNQEENANRTILLVDGDPDIASRDLLEQSPYKNQRVIDNSTVTVP